MSVLQDIEKVTEESFLFVLFDGIFLISPGLLTIFIFRNDIFFNIDSIKLVLLSITISLPFILFNFSLLLSLAYKGKLTDFGEGKFMFVVFTTALIFTNILFYLLLFVSYLIKTSFQNSLYVLIGVELILLVVFFVLNKKIKKKINKSTEQSIDYIPS